jgi:hypothetical protein
MFNIGRDICHYRRGQLNPTTIRNLMIVYCYFHRSAIDEKKALDLEGIDLEEIPEDEIIAELERRRVAIEEAMDFQYISDAENIWDYSPDRRRHQQRYHKITQDLNSDYTDSLSDGNDNIDHTVYDICSSSPVDSELQGIVQRSPSRLPPLSSVSRSNNNEVIRNSRQSLSPDELSQVTLPAMRRRKKGCNQLLSLSNLIPRCKE